MRRSQKTYRFGRLLQKLGDAVVDGFAVADGFAAAVGIVAVVVARVADTADVDGAEDWLKNL